MILKMTLNDYAARHDRYKPADDTRSLRAVLLPSEDINDALSRQAVLHPTLSILVAPTSSKACRTHFFRRVHCARLSRRLVFANDVSRLMRYFATAKGAATRQILAKQHSCLAKNLTCPTPKTSSSTFQTVAEWLPTPGTFDVRLLAIGKLLEAAKPRRLSEGGRRPKRRSGKFDQIKSGQVRRACALKLGLQIY
jgi:hypothetical protein